MTPWISRDELAARLAVEARSLEQKLNRSLASLVFIGIMLLVGISGL